MSHINVRRSESGAAVVLLAGRLDSSIASELRENLHDLVRAGHVRVVIDLSETESIDSSGLGVLISGLKAARRAGGDVFITAPSRQVTAILELTGLDRIISTRESAMTPSANEPGIVSVLQTITGPDTLDKIHDVMDQLSRSGSGLSATARMHLTMAVSEIGANIVQHSRGGLPVRMSMLVWRLPKGVEIGFTDDGDPANVDLTNVHMPDVTAECGRGLAIAKSCVDRLEYRRDSAGNHWTLTVNR